MPPVYWTCYDHDTCLFSETCHDHRESSVTGHWIEWHPINSAYPKHTHSNDFKVQRPSTSSLTLSSHSQKLLFHSQTSLDFSVFAIPISKKWSSSIFFPFTYFFQCLFFFICLIYFYLFMFIYIYSMHDLWLW